MIYDQAKVWGMDGQHYTCQLTQAFLLMDVFKMERNYVEQEPVNLMIWRSLGKHFYSCTSSLYTLTHQQLYFADSGSESYSLSGNLALSTNDSHSVDFGKIVIAVFSIFFVL